MENWTYYNRAIIYTGEPKRGKFESAEIKEAFRANKKALFVRYTTDYDCGEETNWWYCIKDTQFDINLLKAKRRYVVKKGCDSFATAVVDPRDYIDDFYRIISDAFKGYTKTKIFSFKDVEEKCGVLGSDLDNVILGAFSKESMQLCGYTWCKKRGKSIMIVEQHAMRACEKQNINAALIEGVCHYYANDILNGYYLCDGERNILHETSFQDYLIKYFSFRKAYCRLHVEYRWWVSIIVRLLFPFRHFICFLAANSNSNLIKKIDAVLFQESIVRGDECK